MIPEPTQDLAQKRASLLLWRVWMWPEKDRTAWEAALGGMAVGGPFNPATNWSCVTRKQNAAGYGRYLSWLLREGLLVEDASPREREDFVFDPLHYLALLERKTAALDQAAPLVGWGLPEEFETLRRLLEAGLTCTPSGWMRWRVPRLA